MKSFRLWEGNRKIFLYPENWIEPELRDDRTPFFQDFQKDGRHEHAFRPDPRGG